ncbi:hypothetical protein ACNQGB_13365 [Flavobacterium sp. XS1P32]|uniref:hypothetical protein n=1 Tax=Flavobacterium sp. XS1P32 TaxID=3401726 RepID=UPI003AAFE722
MNKSLFFLILVIISCNSTKEISNSDKEKITSELDYIFTIDQKYSFATPSEDLIKNLEKMKLGKFLK